MGCEICLVLNACITRVGLSTFFCLVGSVISSYKFFFILPLSKGPWSDKKFV